MFDIGFFEIIVICIVGLLVVGPERLPSAIRNVMRIRRQVQNQFSAMKNTLETEIGADEIRRQLHNESIMNNLDKGKAIVDNLNKEMHALNQQAQEHVVELKNDTTSATTTPKTP